MMAQRWIQRKHQFYWGMVFWDVWAPTLGLIYETLSPTHMLDIGSYHPATLCGM